MGNSTSKKSFDSINIKEKGKGKEKEKEKKQTGPNLINKYSLLFEQNEKNNKNSKRIIKYASIFEQIKQNIIAIKKKYKIGLVQEYKTQYDKTQQNKTKFGIVIKYTYGPINHLITTYGIEAIPLLTKYIESEVDIFYVSNVSDGIIMRKYGIKKPIMVLYYVDPSNILDVEKYELEIIIPNIEYLKSIIGQIEYKIKVHLWYNSGLGKEGVSNITELMTLYKIITTVPTVVNKVQILGLGTKYNTSNIKYKNNKKLLHGPMPTDIIEQHNKFKLIVQSINNPDIYIHASCTFELERNFREAFFDTVRIGKLIYRNVVWSVPIIAISYRSINDCMGYYCDETYNLNKQLQINKNSTASNKQIKLAFLKNTIKSNETNTNRIRIFAYDIDGNKLIKLNTLFTKYDPLAVIIPDDLPIKLTIGDQLVIKSNDLYGYK